MYCAKGYPYKTHHTLVVFFSHDRMSVVMETSNQASVAKDPKYKGDPLYRKVEVWSSKPKEDDAKLATYYYNKEPEIHTG